MGEAFQQAPGHQQKYCREGQPGTDGHGLDRAQSVFATAEDQRRRNGTFHDHPEYTLSRRGIGFAASGDTNTITRRKGKLRRAVDLETIRGLRRYAATVFHNHPRSLVESRRVLMELEQDK